MVMSHQTLLRIRVAEAIADWLKESTTNAVAPDEVEVVPDENDGVDPMAAAAAVAPPPRTRQGALLAKITDIMKTFVTIVVFGDLTTVKGAVRNACVQHTSANGDKRLTIVDPGLDNEPSAAFTKSHDMYARQPGLNKSNYQNYLEIQAAIHSPSMDVMCCFDGGHSTT